MVKKITMEGVVSNSERVSIESTYDVHAIARALAEHSGRQFSAEDIEPHVGDTISGAIALVEKTGLDLGHVLQILSENAYNQRALAQDDAHDATERLRLDLDDGPS
jgi:hypothetical protein